MYKGCFLFQIRSAGSSRITGTLLAILVFAVFTVSAGVDSVVKGKIDAGLVLEFQKTGSSSREAASVSSKFSPCRDQAVFIVYLKEKADLSKINASGKARKTAVLSRLQDTARVSQANLLGLLDTLKGEGHVSSWQSFYITNAVAVKGDEWAARRIAGLDEIRRIASNYPVAQSAVEKKGNHLPQSSSKDPAMRLSAYNWNVDVLDAERVWSDYSIKGEGVVIGSISTGIDWEHPALKEKYVGWDGSTASHHYNWFDFDGELYGDDYGQSKNLYPVDYSQLGTFTMGCALGDGETMNTQVGVAPGAGWISVTPGGMQTKGNYTDDIMMHKCFQWMLAPTDLSGDSSSEKPERAPDVIFCTFSTTNPLDETFREDIQSLTAAGIFVIAPAGDVGDVAGGLSAPGSLPEAFTVGAVGKWGDIYELSGRGPSPWGEIKPELCAPGVDVYGCIPGGSYESGFTGTSIAAPHVAGIYALLKSADPTLPNRVIDEVLRVSCTDLGEPGDDNTYGAGYVNAWRAIRIIQAGGILKGIVTRSDNGQPVPGVKVMVKSRTVANYILTATTAADGSFTFNLETDIYDVAFTSLFFDTLTYTGIVVRDGLSSVASAALTPRQTYTFNGRILESKYGLPRLANIVILGTGLEYTTDNTGVYSFDLPPGEYQVKVTSLAHRSAHRTIEITGNLNLDFYLDPAPKILLVDAEASLGWDKGWKVISYYEQALEAADYAVESRSVTGSWLMPTLQELRNYDVVIWVQANRGTSSVNAESLLRGYLDNGGKLLLFGQNIGVYDGATDLYTQYLKARLVLDDASSAVADGANILGGVSLTFVGTGHDQQGEGSFVKFAHDIIAPLDSSTVPCLYYPGGKVAALASRPCNYPNYRVMYFALGLESVVPSQDLADLLDQSISWLVEPTETYDLRVSPGESWGSGEIGRSHVYYQTITNMGAIPDSFLLSVEGNTWPTTIWNQDLTSRITETGSLPRCNDAVIAVKVDLPTSATAFEYDTAMLNVKSKGNGSIQKNLPLRTLAFVNWKNESPMLTKRYRHVSETVDGCSVFVIGGLDWISGEALAVNERYDTGSGSWTPLARKPVAAANCGSAVLNGMIYLIGGFNLTMVPARLSFVDVYDPQTDSWEQKSIYPHFASGLCAVNYKGNIYTFGGFDGSRDLDEAYRYDHETDKWIPLAPMPGGGRSQCRAVALNEKIYVIGGWPNLFRVECYDPAKDSWETKSPLLLGRHSFGCETIAEGSRRFIYVFGGGSNWNGLDEAERYDPEKDEWTQIYSLIDNRRTGVSSTQAGGKLYAFGGIGDTPAGFVEFLPIGATLTPSDIQVSKDEADHQDLLEYEIHLRNGGFALLPGVSLSNPLSTFVDYIPGSATGGLEYNAGKKTLEWSGDMLANQEVVLTFQVKINDLMHPGGVIENVMELEGDSCGTIQRKAVTTISGPLLVESRKTVNKQYARHGDTLDYTIYMVNRSEKYDALTVELLDPIPSDTSYVAGSLTGEATYNSGENRIEWNGNLLKASPSSVDVKYQDSETTGVSYSWLVAPTLTSLEGDDVGINMPIGFPFTWFGKSFTDVGISVNGYLTFGTNLSEPENDCLPTIDDPNLVIAPFWDDLKIARVTGDGVWVGNFGTAPNRMFVVSWKAHDFYDSENQYPAYQFQAILHEQEGEVVFQYKAMDGAPKGDGSSATTGIENQNGTLGLSYLCDGLPVQNNIHDGLAVKFTHVEIPFIDERTFTFQLKVDDDPLFCDLPVTNTASLNFSGYTLKRSAVTKINVTPVSESSFVVDKPSCPPGEKAVFTLNVKNSGDVFGRVTAQCTIPDHSTFIRVVGSVGSYNPATELVEWTGLVGGGVTQPISFEVELDDPLPDGMEIRSDARVTAECAPDDISLSATSLVASYNLTKSAILCHPSIGVPGRNLNYSIDLINTGGDAVSVTVQGSIPHEQLKMVPGSVMATGGNVHYDYQLNILNWAGEIPAGSSITIFFEATVRDSVQVGSKIKVSILVSHPTGTLERSLETPVMGTSTALSTGWMVY